MGFFKQWVRGWLREEDEDYFYSPYGRRYSVPQTNYHSNSIKCLTLYKEGSTWKFDDKFLGITGEPFVIGASEAIQKMVNKAQGINKKRPVVMVSEDLTVYDAEITLLESDIGSTYIYEGEELWLCPVLLRFFEKVPERIRILFVREVSGSAIK